MAGKEGTAGVRCTSGETRRGAGFDRDTCSAGFCSVGGGHSNFFDFDGDEILAHLSLLIFSSVPGSGFLSKEICPWTASLSFRSSVSILRLLPFRSLPWDDFLWTPGLLL